LRSFDPDGRFGEAIDTARRTERNDPVELETITVVGSKPEPEPPPARGMIRNPEIGFYSDIQADYLQKEQQRRDVLLISEPARVGIACALGGCRLIGKTWGKGAWGKKGAAVNTGKKFTSLGAAKKYADYLGALLKPIEVPTDAEILKMRSDRSTANEWWKIAQSLVGFGNKVSDAE